MEESPSDHYESTLKPGRDLQGLIHMGLTSEAVIKTVCVVSKHPPDDSQKRANGGHGVNAARKLLLNVDR